MPPSMRTLRREGCDPIKEAFEEKRRLKKEIQEAMNFSVKEPDVIWDNFQKVDVSNAITFTTTTTNSSHDFVTTTTDSGTDQNRMRWIDASILSDPADSNATTVTFGSR